MFFEISISKISNITDVFEKLSKIDSLIQNLLKFHEIPFREISNPDFTPRIDLGVSPPP